MNPADLFRRLARKRGLTLVMEEGGRHTRVRLDGRGTVVPRHAADMRPATFAATPKQPGLTRADMEE